MIGYYVHHQGRGHLHRASSIAEHATVPVTLLSSLPKPEAWTGEWVHLPRDESPRVQPHATANGVLHWAPAHHPGQRARMAMIATWIDEHAPALFVSDVSVEVALTARLMGIPVVAVAMPGDRTDQPHRIGYTLADALLAPWPSAVSPTEPQWPESWQAKTCYSGAFSRFDERLPASFAAPPTRRTVVVMFGAGGSTITGQDVAAAARATPDWNWRTLGAPGAGWVRDPWPTLCEADVVVTHAGQNALAECAAARRPTIVIPQERPHAEQRTTAAALGRAGLALVQNAWPDPAQWPALLQTASTLDGQRWKIWSPGDGARVAATFLSDLATHPHEPATDFLPKNGHTT